MRFDFKKNENTKIELGDLIITDIDSYLVIQQRTKIKLLSLTSSVVDYEFQKTVLDTDFFADGMFGETVIKVIKSYNLEIKEI